jgi:hypothetical protein
MSENIIKALVASKQLRPRQFDKKKIQSMINAATKNAQVIKKILLTDETATLIFRETYESIRQLGDATWWLQGYEPRNHDVSMDILKEHDIKEKILLNQLPRFKSIRNDANYRGYTVTIAQAKEILDFWKKCGQEIIETLTKKTQ